MNGRQLSEKLDISQAHVSRLRSGDRLPSMALMWAVDAALGWPAADQMVAIRQQRYHTELNARLDDTPDSERQAA